MGQNTSDDILAIRNKLQETARFIASCSALSGGWYFEESKCIVTFAKGATQADAGQKALEAIKNLDGQ
jgi:hypothetical protein